LVTSPLRASFESVVLTEGRPSPVALATCPAVIGWPPAFASASRTARRVAPEAVRVRPEDEPTPLRALLRPVAAAAER
jgi:hypothetical protein